MLHYSELLAIQFAYFSLYSVGGQDTPSGNIIYAFLQLRVELLLGQTSYGNRRGTGEFHLEIDLGSEKYDLIENFYYFGDVLTVNGISGLRN